MAGILPIERCFAPKKQEEAEEDSKMYKSYAEMVSSLPSVDSWGSKFVLYKGFWFFADLLPGIMAFQDHFKVICFVYCIKEIRYIDFRLI